MRHDLWKYVIPTLVSLALQSPASAGQAPDAATAADVAISHGDRVYTAEQFSNTISVTDPVDNRLLGVIRLGDPQPANLSPLYRGQVLCMASDFRPTTGRSPPYR